MIKYFNHAGYKFLATMLLFALILITVYIVYKYLFKFVRKKVTQTPGKLDDFIVDLFKIPLLWITYWIILELFTHIIFKEFSFFPILAHTNTILLIFAIAWLAIKIVRAGSYYLQNNLDINIANNLKARRSLTQLKVFQRIANTIIVIVAIATTLLTFEQAKNIGISLLTSAGIIGIIIGFAAQKSIGMILAGVQLAVTQPIRLDDVVIVEGEWGRVEEITLTYVVVKIWDERRLILPVNYFLEKPFQNWTRTSADITGSVFIYVDFNFPVDSIRAALPDMLKGNPDWDERILNVQVTKVTEMYKEIRILLSSSDASKNWDLRACIREKLIDFVNLNYPETFAKIRINRYTNLA